MLYNLSDEQKRRFTVLFNLFCKKDLSWMRDRGIIDEEGFEVISRVKRLAENVYPGMIDINYTLNFKSSVFNNTYGSNHVSTIAIYEGITVSKVHLTIRFPSVTITNSIGKEHEIRELFVKIKFTPKTLARFDKPIGKRMSVSIDELNSFYSHSHLSAISLILEKNRQEGWGSFCLGTGDLQAAYALHSNLVDEDAISLIFWQLGTYVAWESLEGGPYTTFSNVADKSDNIHDFKLTELSGYCQWAVTSLSNAYYLANAMEKLSWTFSDGKYRIVDNSSFENLLTELFMGHWDTKVFVSKAPDGKYFKQIFNTDYVGRTFPEYIIFQNKKIFFTVTGVIKPVQVPRVIHPKIKNYVKQYLENRANTKKIRETVFNR